MKKLVIHISVQATAQRISSAVVLNYMFLLFQFNHVQESWEFTFILCCLCNCSKVLKRDCLNRTEGALALTLQLTY